MYPVYARKFLRLSRFVHCIRSDGARSAITKADAERRIANGWRIESFKLRGSIGYLELTKPESAR